MIGSLKDPPNLSEWTCWWQEDSSGSPSGEKWWPRGFMIPGLEVPMISHSEACTMNRGALVQTPVPKLPCRMLVLWVKVVSFRCLRAGCLLKSATQFPVLQAAHRLGAGRKTGSQAGSKFGGWQAPWGTMQMKTGDKRSHLIPGL